MSKARTFALIALLAFPVGKAFALAVPIITSVAVHAGLLLALYFGAQVNVFKKEVKPSADATTPIVVTIANNDSVDPTQMARENGISPPATTGLVVPAGATFTATVNGQTFTGSGWNEILNQMMAVGAQTNGQPKMPYPFSWLRGDPSAPILNSETLSYQRNTTTGQSYIAVSAVVTKRTTPVIGYTTSGTYTNWCSSSYSTCSFNIQLYSDQPFTCPAGYAPSTTSNTQCVLVDAEAARAASSAGQLRDNHCHISKANQPNPFDPDCADLLSKGLIGQEQTANGTAAVVRDPYGTNQTLAKYPLAEGRQGVSLTTPTADGGTNRQDMEQNPTGVLDKDKGTSPNPAPAPAPSYPGQGGTCDPNMGPVPSWCSGGGGSGTGTDTGSGISKGDIADGVREGTSLKEGAEIGSEDLGGNTPDATDSVFARFLDFKNFTLPDPGYSCSQALDLGTDSTTLDFDSFLGGSIDVDFNLNQACPLITPHEQTIRQLTLALWAIGAIFLLIRETI